MKMILNIIKKEFQQFKRDPKMFGIVLIAPFIQLIFLGYAANFDLDTIHTAVFDQDKTVESRSFLEKFTGSGYFDFDYHVNSYDEISDLIDRDKVTFAIVIPSDFDESINRNEPAPVQAIFDASNGNTASIAMGYLQGIATNYSRQIILEKRDLSGNKFLPVASVEPQPRVWYNPELKTRMFMVPAIVGMLVMIITIILTSLAIVKEKEIGTLEQLIVTPIKPIHLIIGKMVPFAIMGLLVTVIVLSAMYVIFGIVVRGSILFLYAATFVFILSTLGLGLFVSTISKTQQQAMMLAIFAIMMPMVYLSGFAFPIENMPQTIQYFTYLIPLRYFITIIRGVILKGNGFAELWPQVSALLGIGIVILFLSMRRFRKRID